MARYNAGLIPASPTIVSGTTAFGTHVNPFITAALSGFSSTLRSDSATAGLVWSRLTGTGYELNMFVGGAVDIPMGTVTTSTGVYELPISAIEAALTSSGRGAVAGDIKMNGGSTAPAGWLKCNGAAVSRTTYASLFGTIGTIYGVGNGSTTFNLPDLRGEFVRGWDDGRGVDGGRVIGSSQAQAIQNHGHGAGSLTATIGAAGEHDHTVSNNVLQFGVVTDGALLSSAGANIGVNDQGTSTAPDHTHPATITGSTGTTGGTETRPRNVATLFCIKF